MAKVIQLKRGNSSGLSSVPNTNVGEPIFTPDDGKLYVANGTAKVLINPDKVNEATEADKLSTARTITISGDADGSANFDGSANANISLILKNSGVTAGQYSKLTVNAKGVVTAGGQITAADIPNLTLSKITDAGTAASKNIGTNAGDIPVLDSDGKISESMIPAVALVDVHEASTEVEMLALNCQQGDICIRSDVSKSFILTAKPATNVNNWKWLKTPDSSILSVNGQTGVVNITTITGNAGTATKLQTPRTINGVNFDGTENITITDATKANIASPTFTGSPKAPTPSTNDNSTQIATTAFVKAQGYITAADITDIDGGTF